MSSEFSRRDFLKLAPLSVAAVYFTFRWAENRLSLFLIPQVAADDLEAEKDIAKEVEGNGNGILLDVPIYSQKDPLWKDEILGKNYPGSGYTIGDYGCLIASYAMLLAASGELETPSSTNKRLKQADGVFKEGDGKFQVEAGERALNLTRVWGTGVYKKELIPDEKLEELRHQLSMGRPAIGWVNLFDSLQQGYQEHYILVVGWKYDPETQKYSYIFNDPWFGEQRTLPQEQFAEKSIAFRTYDSNSEISPNNEIIQSEVSEKFPESVKQWGELITKYAKVNSLDPNLIAAVVLQESGGNPDAYSKSGAVGLMQIMPRDGLAANFRCKNGPCFKNRPTMEELKDPEFNIKYGTQMLEALINRNDGEVREALKMYGPKDVGYYYADVVLGIYEDYK